jgi:signal transduction histidine kinase
MLILLCALLAAQALTFALLWYERKSASQSMMLAYIAKDVASSVALLERLPAQERSAWLDRLERRNYRYVLGPVQDGAGAVNDVGELVAGIVAAALGPGYEVQAGTAPDGRPRLHLNLHDGSPLAIEVFPGAMRLAQWLPAVLCAQLLLVAIACWLAVRLATRPLARLAKAAESLGPECCAEAIPEDGPAEVSKAAKSFNAMQERIARYMHERTQILAAISHDLQTPITRMRLRTDLMDDPAERMKWQSDLEAMQALVQEGIAYARSAHAAAEEEQRIDLDSLLGAIVADYADAGADVSLTGTVSRPVNTKPQALRRIMTNLVDNAIKFAGTARIEIGMQQGRLHVAVLDRGPGIPEHELQAVLQPFYRLERSRNAESGGSGLGLAIAHQLTQAIGGSLTLSNRDGGGLRASVAIPVATEAR